MKKTLLPVLLLLVSSVGLATAAMSGFQVATADVNQNGFLITIFKEAGLPPGTVSYQFSAMGEGTYACLANAYNVKNTKKYVIADQTTSGEQNLYNEETMQVPKSGKMVDGMAIEPPEPPTAFIDACSAKGGMVHLIQARYWNVRLYSGVSGEAELTGNCAGDGCTVKLPGR